MTIPDAQRLRELEEENPRLKRRLAERDLEVDALKVLLQKSRDGGGTPRGSPGPCRPWVLAAPHLRPTAAIALDVATGNIGDRIDRQH
jgi:hypothetical protein